MDIERLKYQPRVFKWMMGLLFFIFFANFVWPSLTLAFPRLACTYTELNLTTGQIRYRTYLLFIPLPQRVNETPISKHLASKSDASGQEDWIKLATVGSRGGSRRFPKTMNAMDQLERTWATYNFTEKAREKTAGQLLEILRAEKFRASKLYFDYLRKLCDQKLDSVDPTQPTTAADIPDDLAERSIAAWDKINRQD